MIRISYRLSSGSYVKSISMRLYWPKGCSINIMIGRFGAKYYHISLRISVILVRVMRGSMRRRSKRRRILGVTM